MKLQNSAGNKRVEYADFCSYNLLISILKANSGEKLDCKVVRRRITVDPAFPELLTQK